jgi:hypothetical protein
MFNINFILISMFCTLKKFVYFKPWSNSELHQNSDLLADTLPVTDL